MASKKHTQSKGSKTSQSVLFDVPAVDKPATDRSERNADSSKIIVVNTHLRDVYGLGLNSLYEGRSLIYSSFADYIRRSNVLK